MQIDIYHTSQSKFEERTSYDGVLFICFISENSPINLIPIIFFYCLSIKPNLIDILLITFVIMCILPSVKVQFYSFEYKHRIFVFRLQILCLFTAFLISQFVKFPTRIIFVFEIINQHVKYLHIFFIVVSSFNLRFIIFINLILFYGISTQYFLIDRIKIM